MHTGVVGELGMKSSDELIALTGRDDMPVDACQCMRLGSHRLDERSTDERHRHLAHTFDVGFCGKAA